MRVCQLISRCARLIFPAISVGTPRVHIEHSQCRQQSSVTSSGQFNVGVLGAGRIGKLHVANVLANRKLNLVWVVDDDETACGAMKDELLLNSTPFHKSDHLPSLLSDHSLDGVLILTSTASHTPLTSQALHYGKAVFVEKPAGETIHDIRKCYQTAELCGKPLLTGYNRRFDPTMSEAYRQVSALGKLQYLSFTSRDSPKPSYDFIKGCGTTGCNILSDMSVHDIDMLVWLTNAERPHHIYVTTHAHDPVMAELKEADAISVLIKYRSGAIASLNGFSESVYGYDIRMEIFGSDGCVIVTNPRETHVTVNRQDGGHQNRLYNSFPQRFDLAFKSVLEHFVQCMEGSCSPLVTQEESMLVAEIVEKGLQSFQTGAPVDF